MLQQLAASPSPQSSNQTGPFIIIPMVMAPLQPDIFVSVPLPLDNLHEKVTAQQRQLGKALHHAHACVHMHSIMHVGGHVGAARREVPAACLPA